MRKLTFFKTMLAAIMLLVGSAGLSAQVLVENFDYTAGSLLTANGWTAHSGEGTQSIDVVVPGLSFTGYASSGIGGAANLDNNGEDVNRTFDALTGTVYAAFIIQTEATNSAGYFFHFGPSPYATLNYTRVWVNATGNGVGIGTNAPANYTTITPGVPVLLVAKLDVASKVSSLYVLSSVPSVEPGSPDQFFTETATFTNVGAINLRQYNAAQRIIVDGIRVATNWSDVLGVTPIPNTPTITVSEVSIPAMSATLGNSDAENITVSGANLTGDISIAISGENAAYFSALPASITPSAGTVSNASVTITYTPLAAGSHSATLTMSSPGAVSVTRALTGTSIITPVQVTPPNVIITEVYGGGGNSGAVLKNDFIELYNTTTSPVDISGWSVQYLSAATGTTISTATNKVVIPDGKSIPAKTHFLIQASAGAGGTVDLPNPDAVSEIAASGTGGKVILLTSSEDITIVLTDIASVTGNAAFKDYVPYGTTSVPVWGSAMSSNTSNTTSASRKMEGGNYSYSQNVGFDFEVATPSPTNSLMTSIRRPEMKTDVTAVNGTLRFNATAGELVEVYNVIGQKVISSIANDGLNTIPVSAKGMMVVKIGNKTAKVIL
ncbi:MAG: lamin tail domain-containing protein [Paludibacter sp.]|nr:lamin tail domain-containing protein [Paludibacter sp.]